MDTIIAGIVGAVIAIWFLFLIAKLYTVVVRLERKLDLLVRHAGIDLPKLAEEAAATLARSGKKIEAIKVYRAYTGCSLLEAKVKVESLM
jgi:ribosomal protein L7/L12